MKFNFSSFIMLVCMALIGLNGCVQADVPGARNADIPTPAQAQERKEAINERPDSVMYLPLGDDVLIPLQANNDPLPSETVGPFELRNETVAGALQLILADYDISLAFETNAALTRTITVSNLKGSINKVVSRVCGLANLYCSNEDGTIVVRDTQTFTVKIPPISSDTNYITNIATGLQAVTGTAPVIDQSTRTLIYQATNRTAELAENYFQRMRTSTALIVFETYIWEVGLNSGNSSGVKWDQFGKFGKFQTGLNFKGGVNSDFTNPVSIGLPTTKNIISSTGALTPTEVVEFLSRYGAVKTISQPQVSVLSGSKARLRVADTENYVSELAETIDNGQSTTAVTTDTVDTGFTISIGSAWDNSTIYADLDILLTDVSSIEDFDFSTVGGGANRVQLPKTTEREVQTQIRVRPGDSALIAGLVRESDAFDSTGLGFMRPFLPNSRTSTTRNLELVFLLRPRVVVFSTADETAARNKAHRLDPALTNPASKQGGRREKIEQPLLAKPEDEIESLPTDLLNPAVK